MISYIKEKLFGKWEVVLEEDVELTIEHVFKYSNVPIRKDREEKIFATAFIERNTKTNEERAYVIDMYGKRRNDITAQYIRSVIGKVENK